MKKIVVAFLFFVVSAFAVDVQVLDPTGAEFAPDAPNMVSSLVRVAVTQTGNTAVTDNAEIQIRTTLMTMGNSIVVACEQINNGKVVGSGNEKALAIDNLDVAINKAVIAALANLVQEDSPAAQAAANAQNEAQEVDVVISTADGDANDNFGHKRPTRNYKSYGIGAAFWHNWKDKDDNPNRDWELAVALHVGRIYEATPYGAMTLNNNFNISFSDFELQDVLLIGGRYMFSQGAVTPYVGGGFGLGLQFDWHLDGGDKYGIGLATGLETGIICFRNSERQLEIGATYHVMWDGFDDFDRRFGAGSLYIALNY
ncbi:MAG: hypothetical protein MJY99_06825 [Fibrobacter sp.]|uniref:hypothetical protein n=1 Tax=Fibrobacter sp. TaxID=35828 RepID=UPI00388FA8E1|nr:hypothetical protein [Fibrobacter sp.]